MTNKLTSILTTLVLLSGFWVNLELTAYTHTGQRTASGRWPVAGRTVATNDFPLGTKITIWNHTYTVEDRMHPSITNTVDIFMDTYNQAIYFGRKKDVQCFIELP